MSTNKDQTRSREIETDIMDQLFNLTPSASPSDEASARIRHNLKQRLGQSAADQYFVFADQDNWKQIAPGLQIKALHKAGKARSYLLKLAANTAIPHHEHARNEETFVVNGEVWLDGVFCSDGDYHFSGAGTYHKEIRTDLGCTLLIKTS